MPFIVTLDRGRGTTAMRRVPGERLRIGRGTGQDLRLDDAAVDLEHGVIELRGEQVVVVDQASETGTYVNGERVDETALGNGDVIDLGAYRMEVAIAGEGPGAQVILAVGRRLREEPQEPPPAPVETAARPTPPKPPPVPEHAGEGMPSGTVDYVRAYQLGRGLLSKPVLSLLAVVVAGGILVATALTGRTTAFRPGAVSVAHASAIGTTACGACHRPWRGPVDARCAECHASHPVHQPRQVESPSCGGCHFEHRGLERLTAVTDRRCTHCHADLEVTSGEPRFATRVGSFGEDHPEFRIEVGSAGAPRRLALDEAAARRADPARLAFDHQLHLERSKVTFRGLPELTCASCHEIDEEASGDDMQPVSFEAHCRTCHQLTFDPDLPETPVPHEEPERVHWFLLAAYSEDPDTAELSAPERYRLIVRDPTRGGSRRLSPGQRSAVARAERHLYSPAVCGRCHPVDVDARPHPEIAPVAVPEDWLPHARFPHARHRIDLECTDCHDARQSSETADVLLPGIEICRRCHGEGAPRQGGGETVPSGCADCHRYHHPAEGSRADPPRRAPS